MRASTTREGALLGDMCACVVVSAGRRLCAAAVRGAVWTGTAPTDSGTSTVSRSMTEVEAVVALNRGKVIFFGTKKYAIDGEALLDDLRSKVFVGEEHDDRRVCLRGPFGEWGDPAEPSVSREFRETK